MGYVCRIQQKLSYTQCITKSTSLVAHTSLVLRPSLTAFSQPCQKSCEGRPGYEVRFICLSVLALTCQ